MNASHSTAIKICPECGADCAVTATTCWICRADVRQAEMILQAEAVSVPVSKAGPPKLASEWFFAGTTFLLLAVAILVGIGLTVNEPGAGLVYAIVASPALIATVVRTQLKKQKTGHVSWAERLVTLIVSTALTVGILSLLGAAALVAFFIYCITTDMSMSFR